jgi:murein DD-endopeptidase MepM/ murein hydrolase activator NlpD
MPMARFALPHVLAVLALLQGPTTPAAGPLLEVATTARALAPGEVVRVDVRCEAPVSTVQVRAFDRTVTAAPVGDNEYRALLGIDLGTDAGEYPLVVTATAASGAQATATRTLAVASKSFPTRTLKVNPRFVTPPARVRARIEREARQLREIFATEEPQPEWPGSFTTPIASTVISGFGVRSVYNGQPRSPHSGADFASPTGTPVTAPASGRIVLAGDLYYTGGTLVIAHGGGLYSLFAHLSRRDVDEGAAVEAGQTVGAVGATGRVTGPHLHWTVRLHTARVDPLSLIAATAPASDASH